jgi:hypothetical protein
MKVKIIMVDGKTTEQEVQNSSGISAIRSIESLIGATCLDTVNLPGGLVMLVDDEGYAKGKQVNPEATKLYHSICKPGTTHKILGDVAIVRDADF